MSESVLSDDEVVRALRAPDGPAWELVDGQLVKSVSCSDFVRALAFVNDVGRLAEEANHHPDIDIRYSRVTLALMTHSAGGITAKDLELARAIDAIAP
jgi:4a-hydroxytetrahydrobiopterin dehydratase